MSTWLTIATMAHSEDQLFMTANLNLVGFALHKNYVTQHNEGARARRHGARGHRAGWRRRARMVL